MQPIYKVAVIIVLCFTILGAAGVMFYVEKEDTAVEQKSTEELAAELDQELGITPSEHNSFSSDESKHEENDREDEGAVNENSASDENSNASPSTSLALQNGNDYSSEAIHIASEEGTISVDELLEIINE
ncbi:hypothetical protein [Alteribacillus bidgolensis]|uniref:Uncharacterized protein n=1 Tax=Alteribacillus bidgolensis TaxID=930129 RepID=A0A1G8EUJ1_9BACI|nr:hypothetical protein [Alteribacillus bidgolensis]SDH73524.1 hypothetical protein SAMN05216352_102386 [Alteribacillus bidgolensis]